MIFQALRSLLSRYREALAEAWAARRSLDAERRTPEELEFLPAALSLRDTPVHPLPRRLLWGLLIMLALALGWSTIGRIDVVAVGRGKVVPGSGSKTIQAAELAVVKTIHVRDGQAVRRGDPLIDFDSSLTEADVARISGDIEARRIDEAIAGAMLDCMQRNVRPEPLDAQLADLKAETIEAANIRLMGSYRSMRSEIDEKNSEMSQFDTQLAAAKASVRALERMVPLSREISANLRSLSSKEFVARSQYLDKEQFRLSQERELVAQQFDARKASASRELLLRQKGTVVARWRLSTLDTLHRAREERRSLEKELEKAVRRDQLMHLAAPVDGTVQQVVVKTEGGVVQEAQTLMIVVPRSDPIEVEAMLPNKDVGFVRPGMEVEIKVDAFEFTRYGLVKGTIRTLSTDSIDTENSGPVYAMRIVVDETPPSITLSPGMSVSAEVKIGSRRIIEYFLSPLNVYLHDSLRER
ncbi:HlyD family type I secretion periplasmic adaptor subunit [Aureimonas altamirensis]|uniref:HlyD family type I secretion periplasmic adaptor subunit n=1 Tax=Aureimonas altamirensis TaxID=370622 RepID=UPI002036D652|nr:HlyD family type I secretion periplasmic adaptor subunit [Aureimonas altamirensis]MCM2503418.1 HlyD family type I secretion periplasmic adaptor subunit [Aureimonas altamirensis]